MLCIGISSSVQDHTHVLTAFDNVNAVNMERTLPFVLPNVESKKAYRYVEQLDGVLLTGGGDIDPSLFGEDPHPSLGEITPVRDLFEVAVVQACLEQKKPLLAICRGAQILAIAAGGDMYQDLPVQFEGTLIQHAQRAPRSHRSHLIHIKKGSLLADIAQSTHEKVNSFHHQAVRRVPSNFRAVAWSRDGVIEAIEHKKSPFMIGVQWHPENLLATNDTFSKRLFDAFIQACEQRKEVDGR
ncbi:gamma-glutamyl-gamma-aminobutyrate hydrolase family protein [Shouchella lonarensis]|uniref:Putative glutamine amidotransferase n=1 Tax=Shouchella lonarensis TaxID=1464122 RepID=A0A1G6JZ37_9BACI|nr:gamma-glutamyl-gamma-aminobutyrate hydrolase family protein [Shouchella lonarensis]SDC24000.1 putative glutamine amidotransferase [Shouchella lonarensis]